MRQHRISSLLVALLSAAVIGRLSAAEDPASQFLQAYQDYKAAEQIEVGGKLDDALTKYRFCVSLLEQIQKQHPEYQPVVIEFRLGKSRAAVGRVESLVRSPELASLPQPTDLEGPLPQRDNDPVPTSGPRVPRPPRPTSASPLGAYRIPLPSNSQRTTPLRANEATDSPLPARDAGGDSQVIGKGTALAMQEEIKAMRLKLREQDERSRELNDKLLESMAREQSSLYELDKTKVIVVEQKAQLAQVRQALTDSETANRTLSTKHGESVERIATLEADLEAAKADLEVAEDYNTELFAKLERAAAYIETSDQIRRQLVTERGEIHAKLGGVDGEMQHLADENKSLASERDAAVANAQDASRFARDNKDLSARLATAEDKANKLAALAPEHDKIVTDLRSELVSVNEKLASMTTQLDSGKTRVAEIEQQLVETDKAVASTTSAIAEENALLRSIVTRQLAEQSKRQQARRLVEEEMQKLQIRSASLLAKLDKLASSETSLSSKEQALFEIPMISASGDGVGEGLNFAMVVAKKIPDPTGNPRGEELPSSLVKRAEEANALFKDGEFEEAREIYQQIVRDAPRSYLAIVNLGVSQLQLGEYERAIETLERALQLDPDDPFVLTHLGIANYRAGHIDGSQKFLSSASKSDPGNYQAHNFLGLTLNQEGNRAGAINEFQRAIDLKPDYAQAHLNLAMMYATERPPSKEPARQHYQKAIDCGASPDASLEQLIQ